MERKIIAQALEIHLDPDMRRYQEFMRDYWIELRLCLNDPAKPQYQKKETKLALETNTVDGLKHSIIETVVSSQFDFLLSMAYKANQDAKLYEPSTRIPELGYRFKNFLLNMLINMFAERHTIAIAGSVSSEKIPLLLIQENEDNSLNYDLRFFAGFKLALSPDTKVYSRPTPAQNAIGFHLPRNQTTEPTAKIIAALFKKPVPKGRP